MTNYQGTRAPTIYPTTWRTCSRLAETMPTTLDNESPEEERGGENDEIPGSWSSNELSDDMANV